MTHHRYIYVTLTLGIDPQSGSASDDKPGDDVDDAVQGLTDMLLKTPFRSKSGRKGYRIAEVGQGGVILGVDTLRGYLK